MVVDAIPKGVAIGFLVAAEDEGEEHLLVGAGAVEFGHGGVVVQEAEVGDVAWTRCGGLGEERLVVDGEGLVGILLRDVLPAVSEEVAGVGLLAVRTYGHLRGVGEAHHLFEAFHVGGDERLLFAGVVDDRGQAEQLMHVDGALAYVVGVEVHELEVGERHSASVEHVVLQGRVVVVGRAEPERALHLDGSPLVAVAHQQIDHHQRVVVLEHRFVHHVDGGVGEVLHGLRHLFGELRR